MRNFLKVSLLLATRKRGHTMRSATRMMERVQHYITRWSSTKRTSEVTLAFSVKVCCKKILFSLLRSQLCAWM